MPQSTGKPRSRKPDRPKKPYPAFPLTPHAGGKWMKKIHGRIHYFGNWARRVNGKLERIEGDGWKEALDAYKVQADDLHAGRTPRQKSDSLTVAGLCDRFRTAKLRKLGAKEIGPRTFKEYELIGWEIVRAFGKSRPVDDLAADDFERLRAALAKKWGPVRLSNAVTRVRSVFKYGIDNGLIERAVRFGSEFKKPDKAVLRRHKAKNGERMLAPWQLRALIDGALVPGDAGPELVKPTPELRAMILLALNCGFGNGDCATLPLSALDLAGGWIDYARPKTGIARRCPLWAETVAALREVIATRPDTTSNLVFLTSKGNGYIRSSAKSHKDLITIQFRKLLEALGFHRPGLSFYSLRHVFFTVADGARDPAARDLVMGHSDTGMGEHYREGIADDRLRGVVEHVRRWLEGGAA